MSNNQPQKAKELRKALPQLVQELNDLSNALSDFDGYLSSTDEPIDEFGIDLSDVEGACSQLEAALEALRRETGLSGGT